MSAPSSLLFTLPSGARIFIDANIFIYHFTDTPLTDACPTFLQRVEGDELQGWSESKGCVIGALRHCMKKAFHQLHSVGETKWQ
jgi:hypothetical protein